MTPTAVMEGRGGAVSSAPFPPIVQLEGVEVRIGGRRVLAPVNLALPGGELVAIAGGSGAGKTTLLEVMAGLRRPSSGAVRLGFRGTPAHVLAGTGRIGFVPQDDIIHRELPLRRTLLHAARLRLPRPDPSPEQAVDAVLRRLDLTDRADVRVGSLSGGQRKRASIAVELLTEPEVLFLDEPTSGLDPVSAGEVTTALRGLVSQGVTVVMTTHDPAQIDRCDRVVFLAPEGHLAFAGPPRAAVVYFDVSSLAAAYEALARGATPAEWGRRWASATDGEAPPRPGPSRPDQLGRLSVEPVEPGGRGAPGAPVSRRPGPLRQWAVLTRRSAEVVGGNRLTLAVLVGSPALVITMMAVLFRPGGFGGSGGGSRPDPGPAGLGASQTVFWIAFAGFFFGLTYGLLQIVGERAVLRRERFGGLSPAAYLASKVTLLLPVLTAVNVTLLAVLRFLDRLPDAGSEVYAALLATLVLESLAGLLLGLAASAAVADPAQATLALPMLCFPQVLFAGAVVPVAEMAAPGRIMSFAMATRWAFESLGRSLHLGTGPATGSGARLGPFGGSPLTGWAVLALLAVLAAAAALLVLRRDRPQRPL